MQFFFTNKGRTAKLSALFLFAAFFAAAQSDELAQKSQEAKQLMAAGRFEEAIPIYKQLTQALPGNPGLMLNLGLAQHMAGHNQEAVPVLEAVLKGQPNLVPALISLGAARLAINQPQQAVVPLQKVVAAEPANT